MKTVNKIILVASAILLVGGCANLSLTAGGEKIRILDPDEVATCKKLGKTRATITDSVLGVERPQETLERELLILARNSAHEMGGDTIVALTLVEGGKSTYEVYKCVNPQG